MMVAGSGEIIILTTISGEDHARDFAKGAIERRLAACVTSFGGATSRYYWQSETMTEDREVVLLLKTHRDKLKELEQYFTDEHPYEIPEFLVFEASGIGSNYRGWMREEMQMAAL